MKKEAGPIHQTVAVTEPVSKIEIREQTPYIPKEKPRKPITETPKPIAETPKKGISKPLIIGGGILAAVILVGLFMFLPANGKEGTSSDIQTGKTDITSPDKAEKDYNNWSTEHAESQQLLSLIADQSVSGDDRLLALDELLRLVDGNIHFDNGSESGWSDPNELLEKYALLDEFAEEVKDISLVRFLPGYDGKIDSLMIRIDMR